MTYRGHVKKGVIVLDPPAQLPDGTEVEVRPSEQKSTTLTWGKIDPKEDESLVAGSIAAATASLPREDFSDWEK